MTDYPDVRNPPPLMSPRQRRVLPYVVLVIVVLVAGLVLVRHFTGGSGKEASAGALIFPTDPLPASKHWEVLLPGIRLDAAVTIRSSVPGDLAARTFDAPDDGRFVGIQVTNSADTGSPDVAYVPNYSTSGVRTQTISLQLLADGHTYPLRPRDYVSDGESDVPLAVYVPVAGDPSTLLLKVTQAGRSQSIDLRTGKRTAGDYAPLYSQRASRSRSCGTPRLSGGYTAQYGAATCRYQADRVPYVYGKGWAPKGKTWLDVRVTTRQPGGLLAHPAGVAYYIDSLPASRSPDRLDGAKPITSKDYFGDGGYDISTTGVELLYSVPARGDSSHVLTAVQSTRAIARTKRKGTPFEVTVTGTWTVRIS